MMREWFTRWREVAIDVWWLAVDIWDCHRPALYTVAAGVSLIVLGALL